MSKHFFKTLKIENFRGIKSLEIDDLARVNLFVGENNCGKTTVLEAAFLLAGIGNPGLMIDMQNGRGVQLVEESDIRDFFYNRSHMGGLTLSTIQAKGERKLKVSPLYGNLQTPQLSGAPPGVLKNGGVKRADAGASVTGQTLVGINYDFTVTDEDTGKDVTYQAATCWTQIGNIHFTPFPDARYKESIPGGALYLRRGYNHAAVDEMLNKKQKDLLLSTLKSIDSKVDDIKTGARGLVSVDIGLDSFIPINLLGDGIIRVLNILSEIGRAGVLVIDEIENGLHVTALERAWEVILDQSAKSDTQIFLTTHSGDVIKSLRNVLGTNLFPDAVACYRLAKFKNGETETYRYAPEHIEQSLNSDTDIRI